jgi:Protein of unknown function (DUF5818)
MRIIPVVLATTFLSLPLAAQQKQTYVGIVTDSMCARDHKAMGHSGPEDKCVRDCAGDGKTYKYALADEKGVYLLSDQETPAKFAGKRVKVIGVLYPKTNILKVESIDGVK